MQIQSIIELIDKFKPDCLFKTLVFGPFTNKLVTLIVVAVGLISISGYDTVLKDKNCNLGSGYSKEGNIQNLKARSPLRKVAPNINITFAKLLPKLCKRPRKENTQKLPGGTPYKVIIDLDICQNLLPNTHEQPM